MTEARGNRVQLVDLDEILRSWAWSNYERTTSGLLYRFKKKMKYEHAIIEVNWDHVKIRPEKPTYKDVSNDGRNSEQRVVFESEYVNDSNKDQTHSFRTENETTSTATFIVKKGMRKDSLYRLEVPLPDDMLGVPSQNETQNSSATDGAKALKMATASFGNSLTVDVEDGSTVSKTMKWRVDTTITSREGSNTRANLEINETRVAYDLSLLVNIKGRIVVTILDKHRKHVMSVEGDVATILRDMHDGAPYLKIDTPRRTASVEIEGKVIFVYGVSQRVRVSDEDPAGSTPPTGSAPPTMYPKLP